jgi:hypothetical protein
MERRPWVVRKLWPVSAWLNWLLARGWPNYQPGQTVSEHAAIWRDHGYLRACLLCRLLNVIERDHCARSRSPFDRATDGREMEAAPGEGE